MIKMIAAVCRKPGMTHAECIAHVHQVHGALSRAVPLTLKRYVQNHVFDAAFGSTDDPTHQQVVSRDSVSELFWDDFQGMQATFAHPHTQQKIGPDGANFSDVPVTSNLVAHEVELAVPHPGFGNVKCLHFLRAAPKVDLETFFARWSAAHDHALATAPVAAASIRRVVQNRQAPEANPMLAYFGSKEPPYEGVGALWFADESTVGLFRHYEAAMLDFNQRPEQAFYEPGRSYFVYAREVIIL